MRQIKNQKSIQWGWKEGKRAWIWLTLLTIVIRWFLKTFLNSFTQQMFIEHLFCASHCVRYARLNKPLKSLTSWGSWSSGGDRYHNAHHYLIRVMRTIKQNPVPRRHCKSKGRSSSPSIAIPKVRASETVVHTKVQKGETAAEIPCVQHYSKHMWSWPQPRPSLPLLSSAKCHVSSLATHVCGCNVWRVIISPILAPLEDPGEGVFLKHLFF